MGKFTSRVSEHKCLYNNLTEFFFPSLAFHSQLLSSPFAKQSVSHMWHIIMFIHLTQYEGKIVGNITYIKNEEEPNHYRNPNLKSLRSIARTPRTGVRAPRQYWSPTPSPPQKIPNKQKSNSSSQEAFSRHSELCCKSILPHCEMHGKPRDIICPADLRLRKCKSGECICATAEHRRSILSYQPACSLVTANPLCSLYLFHINQTQWN